MPSPSPAPADPVVLVIDDEPVIGQVLDAALRIRGFTVYIAPTATAGLQLASALEPDVFIVDLGLPDLDGIEVCRQLRRWSASTIIVLTVDGAEDRKVEALDAGADDYVSKPFSMPELLARVRVAVRRSTASGLAADPGIITVGRLTIDTGSHLASVGGAPLHLTRKEFAILAMLARNPQRLTPHRTLLDGAWGTAGRRVEQLRTHINQLRRKLEEVAPELHIINEPGVGYRLACDND